MDQLSCMKRYLTLMNGRSEMRSDLMGSYRYLTFIIEENRIWGEKRKELCSYIRNISSHYTKCSAEFQEE